MWRISHTWDTPQILLVVGKVKHLELAFIFIVNLIVLCKPTWFSWEQKSKNILVYMQIFIAIVFSKLKPHREHHKYYRNYQKFVKLWYLTHIANSNSNW